VSAALLLAAALAAPAAPEASDVYVDDQGCRWIRPRAFVPRKPRAVVPRPAAPAASVPVIVKPKPRPKPRILVVPKTPAPNGDELIGCDEGAPPAPPIELLTGPTPGYSVPAEPAPDEPAFPVMTITPLDRVPGGPTTFEEGCDCGGPVFVPAGPWPGPWPIAGPPAVYAPPPAIPEPAAAYLVLAGLGAIAWVRRRR
jgi:hypothetical protein